MDNTVDEGPTKAEIIVTWGDGKIENIPVLFNPNEYTLDAGSQYAWQTVPGMNMPIAQFVSGEARTLSMELFFDTYEERKVKDKDVREKTKLITQLVEVDNDLHAPPVCRFVWGTLDFKGVVEKVSAKYTMFLESGTPVRATLNVTFREYQTIEEQYQEKPRQSADRTKQRTLKQGEQLWMIAAAEYDDPGLWREIARANGIDNPRKLEAGTPLIIPRLE